MAGRIIEFTATGTPQALAPKIEDYARGRGAVSVLVVPWESDKQTLSMAVTLVESDGWAIEHTNVGTVKLTDLGNNQTAVAVLAHETAHKEREGLLAVLKQFGEQIQGRFQIEGSTAGR
jgi:hypothetical protein